MAPVYDIDLFTYNAKYLQTLFGEKCRSFAILPNILKLLSTAHDVAWQFKSFAYNAGLMLGRDISTAALRSLISSNHCRKYKFILARSLPNSNE